MHNRTKASLICLALALSVLGCGPETTTPTAQTTPAANWDLAYSDDTNPDLIAIDATATDEGFLVVGRDNLGVRIWHADRAMAWTPVPRTDIEDAGPGIVPKAVAAGPEGYVLLGEDQAQPGPISLAVWTSRDGLRWNRIDDADFRSADNMFAADLIWSGGSFLAFATSPNPGEAISSDAVVLSSEDGSAWTRSEELALTSSSSRVVEEATSWGAHVVAVAQSNRAIELLHGRDGGRVWSVNRPAALTDVIARSISGSEEEIAIGGCLADPDRETASTAMIAIGRDGPFGPFEVRQLGSEPKHGCVEAVDRSSTGLVAVGSEDGIPAVWEGDEKRTWHRVDLPGAADMARGSAVSVASAHGFDLVIGHAETGAGLALGPSGVYFWLRDGRK